MPLSTGRMWAVVYRPHSTGCRIPAVLCRQWL